ncbi:recombinase family protein [Rubrivivax gelatinosus]|uniref:recombinase family protein n=1 Tax=Rubrivivax gelatinosus TaxID=28068 RepID=UPI0010493485|nr:recombinase family protein [Rubrivivax gelatinosus]MBK1686239.1 hypothetical protein [Rubrivivax gelatinosus]
MSSSSNPPLRAVLYARYSSDRQRETSIDDQVRAGRALIARERWSLVGEWGDEEISGSVPVALRPGGKALLAAALAGRFDVLVLEGLDRLARELGEQESIVKRLEHRGIRIVGTADGYDSGARGRKVMRIARGLINELYLDDLREKTHRGLAGQFDRGYHVGGVTYGYRSEATDGGAGRRLVVVEEEAKVVREIFEAYAGGESARAICHRLNEEGQPSPRGGTWAVSALVGDRARGAGLLNNELYAGKLIWNRRQWLKDPDSGKRRYVDRPREEWQVREVPELRIVPAELWDAVRARDRRHGAQGKGAKPRTLFAGILRCSSCGGPMTAIDARRYGCNAHHDRGPAVCANRTAFRRRDVDQALLGVVRQDLLAPEMLAHLQASVRAAIRAATAQDSRAARAAAARQAELRGEISRLVDAVARVGISDALRARLEAAEAELAALQAPPRPVADVERAASLALAAYRRRLLDLQASLERASDRERTRELLADIVGQVLLRRDDAGDWAEMEEPAQRLALTGSASGTGCGGRI